LDTSILYPHYLVGRKRSLKELAKKYLGSFIQDAAEGHDSKEDALACLKLIKLKLKHGQTFGLGVDPVLT
jgi:RNA exonuclease 1